jgi:hypothetical protein
MVTLSAVIEFLIHKRPGLTEIGLAEAIYGDKAYQQQVNQDCRRLTDAGRVQRQGAGGPGEPFKYYPARAR